MGLMDDETGRREDGKTGSKTGRREDGKSVTWKEMIGCPASQPANTYDDIAVWECSHFACACSTPGIVLYT